MFRRNSVRGWLSLRVPSRCRSLSAGESSLTATGHGYHNPLAASDEIDDDDISEDPFESPVAPSCDISNGPPDISSAGALAETSGSAPDIDINSVATVAVHKDAPRDADDGHSIQVLPDEPLESFEASMVRPHTLTCMDSWTDRWSELIRFRWGLILPKEGEPGYDIRVTETDRSNAQGQLDFFKTYRGYGFTRKLSQIRDKADEFLRRIVGRGSTNSVFLITPLSADQFLRARILIDGLYLEGVHQMAQDKVAQEWQRLESLQIVIHSDWIETGNELARLQDTVVTRLRDLLAETGDDGMQASNMAALHELEEDCIDCIGYGERTAASLHALYREIQHELAHIDPYSILHDRFLALRRDCERGKGALVSGLVKDADRLGAELRWRTTSFSCRHLWITNAEIKPARVLALCNLEIMAELQEFEASPPPYSSHAHEDLIWTINAAVETGSVTLGDARLARRVLHAYGQQIGIIFNLPDLPGSDG